ncbi:MAG: ribosome biogenesis GTP-binding protein YihA/YsxC [Bacteroidales bacterium]
MIIHSAEFVKSSSRADQCPPPDYPEFAFIGRSNVGKSSLINMLTGFSKLAKISGTPGKTQTINHFIINGEWYLTDLPGYGYAKVSRKLRENWQRTFEKYILQRENLVCLFVLIDIRHLPLKPDLEFMEFLGINQVPFARVFTKADKQTDRQNGKIVEAHNQEMLKMWESLPDTFISSAVNKSGREEILEFIEKTRTKLI